MRRICFWSLLAATIGACTELPFGKPCDVDADCGEADGVRFVCVDDACVPEDDAAEGEGEGDVAEGEGEGGEGEGEPIPGIAHIDVSGVIGPIDAVAMDARGDFLVAAVVTEFDELRGTSRVDLYRMTSTTAPERTTIVGDVGTFGHWVDVAVDDEHTSTVLFSQPNAASTGAVASVVVVDDSGVVVGGPTLIVDDQGGSQDPRGEVAIGPDGVARVAVKAGDGSAWFAEGPSFSASPIADLGDLFSENELQRLAVTVDDNGDAHVVAWRDRELVHAFQAGGATFTVESVDSSDTPGTYASVAVDAGGRLVAAYDIEVGFNLAQCLAVRSGGAWGGCQVVPIGSNTHSDALALPTASTFAIAYADASGLAPVLVRTELASLDSAQPFALDVAGGDPSFTTTAVLGDGRVAVGYALDRTSDTQARVRIALVDP